MKKIFFDSSVYVKTFSQEPGSEIANQLIQLAYDGRFQILLSQWAINETFTALDRKIRYNRMSKELANTIIATVFKGFINWTESSPNVTFVPVDEVIVDKSRDLILTFHLSADDAVHVYTAFMKGCEYFLCHDSGLKNSIENRLEGMSVLDINNDSEMKKLLKEL